MARSTRFLSVGIGLIATAMLPLVGSGRVDSVSVTRESGGSVQTVLGFGIVLNKDSTLKREFIAVHQADLPADLQGTPGVGVLYKSGERYSSGGFEYAAGFDIIAKEPLSAIEIRFLTFDLWGECRGALSMTEVRDFPANTHTLQGKWNLFSENEASAFYASIAYIARVRTNDGRVVIADIQPVIAEARKFSEKFTAADLEPERPGKPTKQ